jgi:hypothetical protein
MEDDRRVRTAFERLLRLTGVSVIDATTKDIIPAAQAVARLSPRTGRSCSLSCKTG